jgi:hypothetical protein
MICQEFERISVKMWERIKEFHEEGLNPLEEGLTRELVLWLKKDLDYWTLIHENNKSEEGETGADLELYLHREGVWYSFLVQSKLIKFPEYIVRGLKQKSGRGLQYNKLVRAANLHQLFPIYFFYTYSPNDLVWHCYREADRRNLGISFAASATLRSFKNKTRIPANELFTERIIPFSCLACCQYLAPELVEGGEINSGKAQRDFLYGRAGVEASTRKPIIHVSTIIPSRAKQLIARQEEPTQEVIATFSVIIDLDRPSPNS